MRLRNNIYEKQNQTKKPVMFIWIFIFILLFIALWILMFELHKQISPNSYIGIITLWSIFSFILLLTFLWLKKWNFSENIENKKIDTKIFTPLIKREISSYLIQNSIDINIDNHQNYYKNKDLNFNFLKQIYQANIVFIVLLSVSILFSILIWLFAINDYWLSITNSKIWYLLLFLTSMILLFSYWLYKIFREYLNIRNLLVRDSVKILKINLKNYTVFRNKIYFY